MKKWGLVLFILFIAFLFTSCGNSDIPLSSGGAKDGIYTYSIRDYDGTLTLSGDNAVFALFTTNGKYTHVIEKNYMIFTGKYKVTSTDNIVIDVEKLEKKLELICDDTNRAKYIELNTRLLEEEYKDGDITEEEYNQELSFINGEICVSDKDSEDTADSITVRIDEKSNKCYWLKTKRGMKISTLSYREDGTLEKSAAKMSLIPIETIHYDENGYEIKDDVIREFYENGNVKTETYLIDDKSSNIGKKVYEYDNEGKLLKEFLYSKDSANVKSESTYIYNEDGINTEILEITYDIDGTIFFLNSKIQLGYRHYQWLSYNVSDFSPEERKIAHSSESYGGKKIKESDYKYDDDTKEYKGYTEYELDEKHRVIKESDYSALGECNSFYTYEYTDDENYTAKHYNNLGRLTYICEYSKKGTITSYYDPAGRVTEIVKKDNNGNETTTYYDEYGNIAPVSTYSENKNGYYTRTNYDKNGNRIETNTYDINTNLIINTLYDKNGYSFKITYDKNGNIISEESYKIGIPGVN